MPCSLPAALASLQLGTTEMLAVCIPASRETSTSPSFCHKEFLVINVQETWKFYHSAEPHFSCICMALLGHLDPLKGGMFGTSVEEGHGNQVGSITALVCRALFGAPWGVLVRNIYSEFLCYLKHCWFELWCL